MTTAVDTLTREQFREQVRDRTDILSLVGRSTALPANLNSRAIKCKCPFHADNGPSLVIWKDQGRWKCFGACNDDGDIFAWVMKRDNVDFETARDTLAQDAGLDVPNFRQESSDQRDEREEAQKLLNLVAKFYYARLLDPKYGADYREYLVGRGFAKEVWEERKLGAAVGDNDLLKMLKRQNLSIPLALKLGLLDERNGGVFDRYRRRVVFPFIENGDVKYMTARSIVNEEPKYLHLDNSPYFQRVPYNWRARGKWLVIVEGTMDVLAVEALAGEQVSALGLMGLSEGNFALDRAVKHRERIYLGLDSDGTVKDETRLALLKKLGPDVRLITWPDDDDPAAWLKQGATGAEFSALLEVSPTWMDYAINQVRNSPLDDRALRVEEAVKIAAMLPLAQGDVKIGEIKKAGRGVTADTIKQLVRAARGAIEPAATPTGNSTKNHAPAASDEEKLPFYYEIDGEMWYGREPAKQITLGGSARYSEVVWVDDGEEVVQQLTIRVQLKDGPALDTQILAEKSAESGEVAAAIKRVAGPKLTIAAYQRPHLIPAMESISRLTPSVERREIARTGWVEFDGKLVFVTAGGTVGELPDGVTVKLPQQGLERYKVADEGDEAFEKGLEGLLDGLLMAFDEAITMPLVAFMLTPPAARFIPEASKFMLHLVGDTGALKTQTGKVAMSMYGNFAQTSPLVSWSSTTNSIEKLGFYLPDVVGMVDDYKPITVQKWDWVNLIQRYADGLDRQRMARDTTLRDRKPMRWWMLSTGQDIAEGEASALARLIALRFPQRPLGQPTNNELRHAERKAKFFPTIMARWIEYLRDGGGVGLSSLFVQYQARIGTQVQKHAPETVNVPRLSNNVALLWAVWEAFQDFIHVASGRTINGFARSAGVIGAAQARILAAEKPTSVFLDALQSGLDAGRFKAVHRKGTNAHEVGGENFVGWFDEEGFYLLPAAYNFVSKWLREAGRQLGFTESEFKRLLKDETRLVATGKDEVARSVRMGENSVNTKVVKVLHLQPTLISTPAVQHAEDV